MLKASEKMEVPQHSPSNYSRHRSRTPNQLEIAGLGPLRAQLPGPSQAKPDNHPGCITRWPGQAQVAASSVKVLKVSLRSEACGDTKEEESCDGVCTDCEYEELR